MVLHVKRILGDPGINGARALYDRGHRLHPAHDRGSSAAPLGSRLTYIHDGQTIEVGGGSLLWKECPNLYHIVPEVAPEMSCDCIRQKCEDFLETLQNTLQGNRLQDEFLIGLANPESLQKIFFSPWLHCPDVSEGGPSQNLLRSALVWLTIEGPTYIPGWEIAGGVGMSFPDVIELRHVNPLGIPKNIHSKLKTVLLVQQGVSRTEMVSSIRRWLLPIQTRVWAPLFWTRGPRRFEHSPQADALSRLTCFFHMHQDSWDVLNYRPWEPHGKLISDQLRTQYSHLPLDSDQVRADIQRYQFSIRVVTNAHMNFRILDMRDFPSIMFGVAGVDPIHFPLVKALWYGGRHVGSFPPRSYAQFIVDCGQFRPVEVIVEPAFEDHCAHPEWLFVSSYVVRHPPLRFFLGLDPLDEADEPALGDILVAPDFNEVNGVGSPPYMEVVQRSAHTVSCHSPPLLRHAGSPPPVAHPTLVPDN